MEANIREHIKSNFKNSNIAEIKEAINHNIKIHDEVALPGMGVFFEIIWQNCDNTMQEKMMQILNNHL